MTLDTPLFPHRHAVEEICLLHRAAPVRDDYELGPARYLTHMLREPYDVPASSSAASISSMTQKGVGRTLIIAVQRHRHKAAVHRPRAARASSALLSGRLDLDVDVASQHVLAGSSVSSALPAKELREGISKLSFIAGELAREYTSHFPGYIGNYTQQFIFRLFHIVALGSLRNSYLRSRARTVSWR